MSAGEHKSDLEYAIFGFVSGLPQTIRNDILLFVVMYSGCAPAAQIERDPDQDFVELMRQFLLRQPSDIDTIGAVLRTIAALDFVIPRAVETSRRTEAIAAKLADKFPEKIERIRMGLPLRQRHYDQVMADWRDLRANSITARTLLDFEDSRLGKIPNKPSE